ncbi:MAG TPA: lasso RiPP family leader peptide-containing protein [Chloroflexota bacterium]|jgi:hypothetical protein
MSLPQPKRPYQTPEIVELGSMEDLTRGPLVRWGQDPEPLSFVPKCHPQKDDCGNS